jgi:predicted transcriptional regulator
MPQTPTITPDLPDQLRAARRGAGLSQAALAELADVSLGSIERWERGLLPKRRSRVLEIVWEALERHRHDGGRPQQPPPVATAGRIGADRRDGP